MKSLQKSVLIWYSAPQMFALVTDVAKYPEFLPWCDHARVVQRDADGMTAELGLSVGGLRQVFTTRNEHEADRRVGMSLVKGPFSNLEGAWTFSPVGAGPSGASVSHPDGGGDADAGGTLVNSACRVSLSLQYGFDNGALQAVVGPVFDRIANSLVDAFVKRAIKVYG